MIAYVDDFKLMLVLTVCVIPLLWLIKPPRRQAAAPDAHVAMEWASARPQGSLTTRCARSARRRPIAAAFPNR
ncbi:hypothetical protein, partial [Staphylococcus aureus]